MSAHRGNSRAHLFRKLKRAGRPDLVEAVEAGRIDVFTAACEMGWRKRLPTLEIQTNARKRREFAMRPAGQTRRDDEMRYGPPLHGPSEFPSTASARAYWHENRERLMAWLGVHGRRPAAWYAFEAPSGLRREYDREQSTLYEAGLLSEAERTELLTFWREEFDRANGPNFFFCEGPGRIFQGPVARKKHWEWADIPRTLLMKWTRGRRRAARTIRKLEAEATEAAE
jgi:hypothetical protein